MSGDAPPDVGRDAQVVVRLPHHLRTLAGLGDAATVRVPVAPPVTIGRILDALEARHPSLGGTIRHRADGRRRSHIRYFAAAEDVSFDPTDAPIDPAVARGDAEFRVLGAIAGG